MIIDSHCHLTYEPMISSLDETIKSANKDGVKYLLTISTEDKSFENILKIVKDFKVLTSSDYTIGIGIPGFSSKETGLINNSNALWLNNKPFKKDLEEILKKELKIMNDANCFTLSESIDGA